MTFRSDMTSCCPADTSTHLGVITRSCRSRGNVAAQSMKEGPHVDSILVPLVWSVWQPLGSIAHRSTAETNAFFTDTIEQDYNSTLSISKLLKMGQGEKINKFTVKT
jgi:hypothetical protein